MAAFAASCGYDGNPGSFNTLEAELWLALMLIKLRRHDEFDEKLATIKRAVVYGENPDQVVKLQLLQAFSQGVRAGFPGIAEQAQAIAHAPGDAVEGCRSFAWVMLALEALRRGDLRAADGYARRMSAESVLGNGCFPHGMTAWALIQIEEATHGPDAVVYMVDRLISDGSWILQDLLATEPGAAAWLVRFMLPRDGRTAETLVAATRKVWILGGDQPLLEAATRHTEGLLRSNVTELQVAADHYADPWAAASAQEDIGVTLARNGSMDQAISALEHALAAYVAVQSARDTARLKRRLHRLGRVYHHARWSEEPDVGILDLTKTEIAVAELVAEGMSNTQAASRLFISRHTVAYHLRSVFKKLRLTSRVELARIWTELRENETQRPL
ncbi:response regulator transcription factor [Streptomyces sp. NPDC091280]|uniref:helix-turn-helix transcriptional regulator n=1 Tax=Streptomyces sp. NPDC091280 TaxID=3365984 RepID=UPI003812F78E